jgi:hypothetical protein
MVSIATASASSFWAVGSLVVAIAGEQVHHEAGSRAAQRDSSHQAQKCDPDPAVGTAANYESDCAGNRQRGQRFLFDVFADVAIGPTPFLVRFHCDSSC